MKVWNIGGHHLDLLTRELPRHRIAEARAAITQHFDNLQLNTAHVAMDHLLQLAECNDEIQETAAPTGEAMLKKNQQSILSRTN